MMRFPAAALFALIATSTAFGQAYTISTIAGGALPVNITGTSASLNGPVASAVDKAGNIFVANYNTLLRLDATTGILTRVAGNGTTGFSGDNSLATGSQLYGPSGIALDTNGNLYIADTFNNRIRRIANGVITTIAGNGSFGFSGDNGPAVAAQLSYPRGIAVDAAGNLYIADTFNNRVRKVSGGLITTVAGNGVQDFGGDNGPATAAQLSGPYGIALDLGGSLYIADSQNSRVRKVSAGVIVTIAGNGSFGFSGDNGSATSATLGLPYGVAVDLSNNVFIADSANSSIRKVSGGIISTVAGNGTSGFSGDMGQSGSAQLHAPYSVAVDSAGDLYIADTGNNRIRKISAGVIATIAGNGTESFSGDNGPSASAQLNSPSGVAVDAAGNVYIADSAGNRVRKISAGVISTVAGNGSQGFSGDNGPAISAQLANPQAVAVDASGNLFIVDVGNDRIRKVSAGLITTVAGNGMQGRAGDNGPATSAQLNLTTNGTSTDPPPSGIAVDTAGNLFITDTSNNVIRKVSGGVITTVAGNGQTAGPSAPNGDGGPAIGAPLYPGGVAVDRDGNLYIADTRGGSIRKVSAGVITSVASNVGSPQSVAVDSLGNLYVTNNVNLIRKIVGGTVSTIAGTGAAGYSGDNGPASGAQLNNAVGLAVDAAGDIYVADTNNQRVRVLTPGTPPSIAQSGIVPIYSAVPAIQPGSWISIYGNNLAAGTALWNSDFPTSLGGVNVAIDNKPAYLWLVSPFQINLQVPDDTATGLVSVAVTTPSGTATSTVMLAAEAPSFSLLGDGKHVAAEILTPDGTGAYGGGVYDLVGPSNTFSYSTRPVKAGETLLLYGVGFGTTTPSTSSGQVFSGAAPTDNKVIITIGGVQATIAFAGITEAGLYQFNVTVPPVASGDQPLQASVNGVQTPLGPVITIQ